jgi:hypothetical protein
VLFKAKDEALLHTLRNMLDKRLESNRENGPLTIDFRQEVVFFGFHQKGKKYAGISLQLIDTESFRRNIRKYLSKGQFATVNGSQALIISNPAAPNENLQQLADRLWRKSYTADFHQPGKKVPALVIDSRMITSRYDGRILVDCFLEDHEVTFDGFCLLGASWPKALNYKLKTKGLSIVTEIIPTGFSDSIARLLPVKDVHLPPLSGIALDYQGTVVDNSQGGMLVLPQMNLILAAETAFSADSIWAKVPVELQGENRTIVMGSTTYQLKQLDEKTVFIGLDASMISVGTGELLSIKGSLKHLTNISSNSYLVAFMDMIPMVKAGKDFVAKTKSIDFAIEPKKSSKSNEYEVKGKLVFNDDAYALNEILRLALAVNPVK